MAKTEANIRNYAVFFTTLAMNENLKHLTPPVTRLIEYSCRLAEDQDKLSTQFGLVGDVVREAHFYAQQDNSKYIAASHVEKAIEAKIYRSNLIQEKLREYIEKNIIFISTDGEAVGQMRRPVCLSSGISLRRSLRITIAAGLGRRID